MAFKQDSFWELHPPVGGGKSCEPGLRAYEVVDGLQVAGALFVILFACLMVHFYGHSRVETIMALFVLVLWPLTFLTPGLREVLGPRYRLYDDDQVEPELDGKPLPLRRLLRRIATTPALWARLGPPEAIGSHSYVFRSAFPELAYMLPAYLFLGGPILLGVVVPLLLEASFAWTGLLVIVALTLFVGAPLLFVWWIRRRVNLGVEVLGSGAPAVSGEGAMASLDEVQDAELRWDYLLGRPYLLLDVYGVRIRYYSPTKEPLHLLRLAKYCTPQVKLRA